MKPTQRFSAANGRSEGAAINVITKSGTNTPTARSISSAATKRSKLEEVSEMRIPAGKVQPKDMDTVNLMLAMAKRVGKPRQQK